MNDKSFAADKRDGMVIIYNIYHFLYFHTSVAAYFILQRERIKGTYLNFRRLTAEQPDACRNPFTARNLYLSRKEKAASARKKCAWKPQNKIL
ncbi:MAG: hypothetical protein Q4B90_04715 [Eubacteriales bacterium]|nr:hypothetical protein [Eubacteriales bacterium]